MSSSGYDDAVIVAWRASSQNIAWTVIATGALQVYDYTICFRREHDLFWRYPPTTASVLYFVNRYSGLVRALYYIILELTADPPHTVKFSICSDGGVTDKWIARHSCIASWYISYVFDLTPLLPAAVFSCLRTYALTQHITLATLVLVLSLAPFVVNWTGHTWGTSFSIDPVFGCLTDLAVTPEIAKIFTTTARLPLLVADLIIVIVTWMKTYELGRSAKSFGITSLAGVLFLNGNIYAITSLMMNIAHFTLTMLSTFGAEALDGYSSYFSKIIDPLTGVLVSWFLLDLQEAAADQRQPHSYNSTSTIRFDRMIGSLAASLPGPLSDEAGASDWNLAQDDTDDLNIGRESEAGAHTGSA